MAALKVKNQNGDWSHIAWTGTRGPSGGPVPVGGDPGQVIVKTGPADLEVGWATHPRIAFTLDVASIKSHDTANTLSVVVSGQATIYPDRTYQIFAGCRCIQDIGAAAGVAQAQVVIGTVNLPGYDVWTCHDTGLWGPWSQQWVREGSIFTALTATLDVKLQMSLSVATKDIYHPRLTIIEY